FCCCHLALAPARALRPSPALSWLALRTALVLPRRGATVLVSRRAALPQPATLVVLAARAVLACRRPVEHRSVGAADVLAPHPVLALRGSAATRGDLRPRRSDGGRRADV